MKPQRIVTAGALFAASASSFAAGGDLGQAVKQATNWTAICMFIAFVIATLFITKWAAKKTRSAAEFYTAGGGITGFQNGLAIAGDFMSAASFLGISAAVYSNGYDGLIYSIGFLVGWPIITFLMAERLRNLGRFTFADVAAYRFKQTPIRAFAASGTLVVVAFYLIAQMVGAGQLIKLLFGLEYWIAVVIVGALMMVYVLFGGMTATTWVQIIKACLLLAGASFMAFMVLWQFHFSPEALFREGRRRHEKKASIMGPGNFIKDPISAISFGIALMFGTAGLPHILMRFFTVPNAKEARKSVFWATTDRLLLHTHVHHRLRRDRAGEHQSDVQGCGRQAARRHEHGGGASRERGRRQRVPRLHLGSCVCNYPRSGGGPDARGCIGGVARSLCDRVQEGQGVQQERTEGVAHHDDRARHRRGRARHRVREAEHRVHGVARVRGRGVRQLSGALHVGPVARLRRAARQSAAFSACFRRS